jgi:hypothetical protein
LFPSIAEYDAKRSPQGRKLRRAEPLPNLGHMVYFARIGASPVVKVGRTSDIRNRAYGHVFESGQTPRYLAQLVVHSQDEAKQLERHVILFARSRFEATKREWFRMSDSDVAEALYRIRETSPVEIIAQRGDPSAVEPEPTEFQERIAEYRSHVRQRNVSRQRQTARR